LEFEARSYNRDMHVRFHSSDPSSEIIKTYLWPALLEGSNGQCLHKGVVITWSCQVFFLLFDVQYWYVVCELDYILFWVVIWRNLHVYTTKEKKGICLNVNFIKAGILWWWVVLGFFFFLNFLFTTFRACLNVPQNVPMFFYCKFYCEQMCFAKIA